MKRTLHSNPQLEEFIEIRNKSHKNNQRTVHANLNSTNEEYYRSSAEIVKRGEKDIQFSEFSAFGPWIYEISPEYPIPRLFLPCFSDTDDAVMMIKVPRMIDRAAANPDMDLYDYVIALYEDHLRILERSYVSVKEYIVKAKEFLGVQIRKSVLNGTCTIFQADAVRQFSFNSISIDIVRKLADLMIEKLTARESGGNPQGILNLPISRTKPKSRILENLLEDLQEKKPDLRLAAIQNSVEIYTHFENNGAEERTRIRHASPEACYLYTDRELIVIENGIYPKRMDLPDFDYTYTSIPLDRISFINDGEFTKHPSLSKCTIHLGSNEVVFRYQQRNKEITDFWTALKKR